MAWYPSGTKQQDWQMVFKDKIVQFFIWCRKLSTAICYLLGDV